MKDHLKSNKTSYVVTKDFVCALVASDKTSNNNIVVWVLGVDCRNIKKVVEVWCSLDNGGDAF